MTQKEFSKLLREHLGKISREYSASLTAEQLRARARNAAKARWAKKKPLLQKQEKP